MLYLYVAGIGIIDIELVFDVDYRLYPFGFIIILCIEMTTLKVILLFKAFEFFAKNYANVSNI